MIDRVKGSEDFESTSFIIFLHHWRKPLLIVTVLAFIASVIFSSPWFITPKFKSTVIMFPTSTNSISKSLLSENTNSKQDILQFGEDEQAEQLLQILNSNRIRDRIIEKFHLMEHYDIKPDEKYKNTKLYNEYEDNIKFSRTEYMAVKVDVLDKDPQYAADIANTIADFLDSTKNTMQKERAIMAFRIVENEYLSLKAEVQMMEDSLTRLREFGVHDYESQSEMINRQLAIELAKGTNKKGIKALEDKLEVLAKYGGPYVSIRDALEYEKKQLSLVKAKYDEAKIDATEVLPQKFIVSKAYKAEKKSYPVRWIIVLISTLSAFLLVVLILAVLDSLSRYNKKKSLKLI
jgi:capsular polysaccharide biosynthesis protein